MKQLNLNKKNLNRMPMPVGGARSAVAEPQGNNYLHPHTGTRLFKVMRAALRVAWMMRCRRVELGAAWQKTENPVVAFAGPR
jgi:hypothetical protein